MPILIEQSRRDGTVRRFVSSDDLERLKQLARHEKRARGIQHHEALEVVARRINFGSWHQVTVAHKAMLPTETAVREGVVIAMDIKEADGLYDEIPLQDGNGRFVADPLLPSFYRSEFYRQELEGIDEEDGRPNREKWTEEQLREFAQERIDGLVFYRFEGEQLPKDPAAVVDLVAANAFFGPEIVWISGQVYDTYGISDSENRYVRF
jgi:hypothetical protein